MIFHKHIFYVFSYIKMFWLVEFLFYFKLYIYIILNPFYVVSYILGHSLIRKGDNQSTM
jgi:hypothetical protein